jgi:hypothetical protein
VPPTVLKEAEVVPGAVPAEAAPAEPEVITKGKKVEEGVEESVKEGAGTKGAAPAEKKSSA